MARCGASSARSDSSWDAAAHGVINLASEVDVAISRLHYYLQRMHNHQAQLESLCRPTQLQMSALEAGFRADVESYLVGVRQDSARLDKARLSLRHLLSRDPSPSPEPAPDPGDSPVWLVAAMTHLDSRSPSPQQPELGTRGEKSSKSDSDDESRGDVNPSSPNKKRKTKDDTYDSEASQLVADSCEESAASTKGANKDADTFSSAMPPGGGSGGGSVSSGGGEAECPSCGSRSAAPDTRDGGAGKECGHGGGSGGRRRRWETARVLEAAQESTLVRMKLVLARTTLVEIHDQQCALQDDLRIHSQRMLLVAAMRRRYSSVGSCTRSRRAPGHGQTSVGCRALRVSVEAAARELLAVRAPLLSHTARLRRLAGLVDAALLARSPARRRQRLLLLPSLRARPLPELRRPQLSCCRPIHLLCTALWRLLRRRRCCCCSVHFCAMLGRFLRSCFCCCYTPQPRIDARYELASERSWLLRSPPRGYSTTRL